VFSEPACYPCERVISIVWLAAINHTATRLRTGTDVARPLVADLARERPLAARLLPARFTLTELQVAQEALFVRPLDKRNFRREVMEVGWVKSTGEMRRGQHRPAVVWRSEVRSTAS
jgi:hypothetical protein